MYWILEVTWTDAVSGVRIDHRPVANGELVSCGTDFDVAWSSAGSVMTADGRIRAGNPPAVTWPHGNPAPVTLRPVSCVGSPLAGPYRRRDAELARWVPPAADATGNRWLIHPASMAGDLWPVVSAMVVDPGLRLVLVWNRANARDDERATALLRLARSLGVADSRIRCECRDLGSVSLGDEDARKFGPDRVDRYGTALVGHTWAATSVLAGRALAAGSSTGTVRKTLAQEFATAMKISEHFQAHVKQYETYSLKWLADLDRRKTYVLVNMRFAGSDPRHNTTKDIFHQVVDRAAALAAVLGPVEVIRIGVPQHLDPAACGWAAGAADTREVDLYADDAERAPAGLRAAVRANKLFQAYFWQRVKAGGQHVNLIGGHSGGMDIASFLGIRTASWDAPDAADHHYMRLHWAAPFHSIIRVDADNSLLDAGALDYWLLGGNPVPVVDGDPVTGTVVGRDREYLDKDKRWFNALWFPLG